LLDAKIGRPLYAFVVAIESVHDVETFTKEHGPKYLQRCNPTAAAFLFAEESQRTLKVTRLVALSS
jgi:hypothetical protein